MIKRFIDIIGAIAGIIILFPIIFVASILVRISHGAPVIFSQKRPGLKSKVFTFYKFRTMTDAKDEKGKLIDDKDRITPVGNFLRKTSFDELPSLFNVLRGDMSLVGPRPLLVEYLDLYTPEQARRHDIKPGISGWAQINGRNTIRWEEKFELDVWYVDNQTFRLDMKILLITIGKVLKREGISPDKHATMEKFKGSQR